MSSTNSGAPRGGIDLGGTKIQAVVVDSGHAVIGQARHPTPTEGGPEDVAAAMASAMTEAAHQAGVETDALAGVGVGSPGDVDATGGTVTSARNLPGWEGQFALGAALEEALGTRAHLGNDVQVATDAEFELGAGRPYQSLLGVFWGTGVGGGIVLNDAPWTGRGAAGEIGHMVVDDGGIPCTCGRRGCWERYASGTALGQQARTLVAEGGGKRLVELAGGDPAGVTGEHVTAAAAEGDADAVAVLDGFADWFALGLANLIHAFDPSRCVIGGGLVAAGDVVFGPIRTALADVRLVAPEHRPPVEVVPATLGARAGAIGAALLARQVSPGRGQPG
jgi:glucokinase